MRTCGGSGGPGAPTRMQQGPGRHTAGGGRRSMDVELWMDVGRRRRQRRRRRRRDLPPACSKYRPVDLTRSLASKKEAPGGMRRPTERDGSHKHARVVVAFHFVATRLALVRRARGVNVNPTGRQLAFALRADLSAGRSLGAAGPFRCRFSLASRSRLHHISETVSARGPIHCSVRACVRACGASNKKKRSRKGESKAPVTLTVHLVLYRK